MIKKYLEEVMDELRDDSTPHESEGACERIPTLKDNCFHYVSPMLEERFWFVGTWEDCTHGDWLTPKEMELFWDSRENQRDERMSDMVAQVTAAMENWEDDITNTVPMDKISVFAASAYTSERVYLVWDEKSEEPKVYAYDCNGNHHYDNLEQYLIAYLNEEGGAERRAADTL